MTGWVMYRSVSMKVRVAKTRLCQGKLSRPAECDGCKEDLPKVYASLCYGCQEKSTKHRQTCDFYVCSVKKPLA